MTEIRHAKPEDLPELLRTYAYAREQMKKNGNPRQWGDGRPYREVIEEDINRKTGYVVIKDGEIAGVFAFILGDDPTYGVIEGKWLNDEPYGTIHRIAANEKGGGVFGACLAFCAEKIGNIRIDTHEDNKPMLHLVEKYGFERCGIIYVRDGTPRIAFQYIKK